MKLFKKPERVPIDVYGAADYAKIPSGFFVCQSGAGKKTLGSAGPTGVFWSVNRPAEMTREKIAEVPRIRLHPFVGRSSVAHVGGHALMDSCTFDSFDGLFEWDGSDCQQMFA